MSTSATTPDTQEHGNSVEWSHWATRSPRIDGGLPDSEWSAASAVAIDGYSGATMLLQNDARFLYVGLELPEDTEPAVEAGDFFWFTVDVDQDDQITPNVDLLYSHPEGVTNRLTRHLWLGPNQMTGALPDPTVSMCARGFGPTSRAAHPHVTWTARFDLAEMSTTAGGVIFFGVRVASTNPPYTYDVGSFSADFSALIKLHLAERPAIPVELAGAVIAGVGLIPATQIVDGYATTDPFYRLSVLDSAFGGLMDLIGNGRTLDTVWAAGARRYRVQHQFEGMGFAPIDQSWTNYAWNGHTYALRSFGPDVDHTYPLPSPSDDYSIDDLLLQWNSTDFPVGLHDFRVEFLALDGRVLPVASDNTLRLMVDNNQPVVAVDQFIGPDGRVVLPCDLVRVEASGQIGVVVTATQRHGHLHTWSLTAEYGDGTVVPLQEQSYPTIPRPYDRRWLGVTPTHIWFAPPRTCAYAFRIGATLRVTNGYVPSIGGAQAFKSLTLVRA